MANFELKDWFDEPQRTYAISVWERYGDLNELSFEDILFHEYAAAAWLLDAAEVAVQYVTKMYVMDVAISTVEYGFNERHGANLVGVMEPNTSGTLFIQELPGVTTLETVKPDTVLLTLWFTTDMELRCTL